jgi:hypothetical protein
MSHICGEGVCFFEADDDERDNYVNNARMIWSDGYKRKHGQFPNYEQMIRFTIKTTDKYNDVIRPQVERRKREKEEAARKAEVFAMEVRARREFMRRSIRNATNPPAQSTESPAVYEGSKQ